VDPIFRPLAGTDHVTNSRLEIQPYPTLRVLKQQAAFADVLAHDSEGLMAGLVHDGAFGHAGGRAVRSVS
jgi:hypothetical protein